MSCKRPIQLILKDAPKPLSATKYASELKASRRESKLNGELLNTGISCGAAATIKMVQTLRAISLKSLVKAMSLNFKDALGASLSVTGSAYGGSKVLR